jgi:hypothetical protein
MSKTINIASWGIRRHAMDLIIMHQQHALKVMVMMKIEIMTMLLQRPWRVMTTTMAAMIMFRLHN